MIRQIASCALLAGAALAAVATPVYAQRPAPVFVGTEEGRIHTVNFTFGWFFPKGEDGRDDLDVLVANAGAPQFLVQPDSNVFDVGEFRSVTFGGEYLVTVGDFLEVGGGLGYSSKTVPAVTRDLLDSDGTEIDQDLELRVVPISITARVLPLKRSRVQPYVGGGIGIFPWRYRESGEFVVFLPTCDPTGVDCPIEVNEFETSGTAIGPILLGGVKYAGEGFSVGGELRWHSAVGEFPEEDIENFWGSEIDLGGTSLLFTVGVRF
jgi:hypothetical protein